MQFKDQLGRTLILNTPPQRIISLVPSQTEFLVDLGIADRLVGCTKFCIHPQSLKKTIQVIGGTKTLNLSKIRQLNPDLIIANKEENEQSQIEVLSKEFPVWISDINNLKEAMEMMLLLSNLLNCKQEGKKIVEAVTNQFETFQKAKGAKKVLYFIWKDPYMLAGANTFIDDMITRIGWNNQVIALATSGRYPIVTEGEIVKINPDLILLSSEPFPFKAKHIELFQKMLPNAKVLIVDGELFSWYGSRLNLSIPYFSNLKEKIFDNFQH